MTSRKLVAYSDVRKELAVFEEEYGSIVIDCTTPKGMKSAKDCRKEIRDARSNLEDLRKETKAPILAKGKQIDEEAVAIKEKLDALYSKFDGEIKAIENKKEIDAAKAVKEQADKHLELAAREQAIFDKEVELGLREPVEVDEPEDEEGIPDKEDDDGSSDDVHGDDNADTKAVTSSDKPANIETICEPHIKIAAERLDVLRKIRELVEPSDAQPEGRIDEGIAETHDAILADVWELVDIFKSRD